MNPYLTRLGIRAELQDWLSPYYSTNGTGDLCFSYGSEPEVFGMAFHRVPLSGGHWIAGAGNLVSQTVICSSAMEAIAWLNCHTVNLDHLLLIATGSKISLPSLPKSKKVLVFGNDLLGHICDLKTASLMAGHPAEIRMEADDVHIIFRYKQYRMLSEKFSLNAFEKISGHRFNIKTSKPRQHSSWLNQLLNV